MNNENEDLVTAADNVAKSILKEKGKPYLRDRFFPSLINEIGLSMGVEIGVDKAAFSNHILSNTKMERYYCVDTWQDGFGSDHRPEYYDKDGTNRYEEAKIALGEHLAAERAALLRMTSLAASTYFPSESLDFCYIDGDHSLEGIYLDMKAWVPKIRIGGIVSGHDYKDGPKSGIDDYYGEQLDFHVKTVVDYFCRRYGYKLNVVGGVIKSWWFVKNHSYIDASESHFLTDAMDDEPKDHPRRYEEHEDIVEYQND